MFTTLAGKYNNVTLEQVLKLNYHFLSPFKIWHALPPEQQFRSHFWESDWFCFYILETLGKRSPALTLWLDH